MVVAILFVLSAVAVIVSVKSLIDLKKKKENLRYWITIASGSIVDGFPILDVMLSEPIKNARYYFDGRVPSISEHERWLEKIFNIEIIADPNTARATGKCCHWKLSDGIDFYHICVTFIREGMYGIHDLYTIAHEEFHVAQRLDANEVFGALRQRLLDRGYDIDWSEFTFEQQACAAGILICWEYGLEVHETVEFLMPHSNVKSTFEKLQNCRIS